MGFLVFGNGELGRSMIFITIKSAILLIMIGHNALATFLDSS